MRKFALAALAAFTVVTIPALAEQSVTEPNVRAVPPVVQQKLQAPAVPAVADQQKKAPAPAVAPPPAPVVAAPKEEKTPPAPVAKVEAPECRDIAVRIPGLKKLASLWLTVADNTDGLLGPMKACNATTEAKPLPGMVTKKTIILHVSQGFDEWAHFSVPSDRAERLKFIYIHFENGKQVAQLVSEPLGTRTHVILEAAKPGTLKVVHD